MSVSPQIQYIAEKLHEIGWTSPCDAQWTKLEELWPLLIRPQTDRIASLQAAFDEATLEGLRLCSQVEMLREINGRKWLDAELGAKYREVLERLRDEPKLWRRGGAGGQDQYAGMGPGMRLVEEALHPARAEKALRFGGKLAENIIQSQSNQLFEQMAEEFHRATGMLAPGKDDAIGFHSREERVAAWEAWLAKVS